MSGREERRRSPRRDEAKAGTRRRVLAAAMEVFAREGYHAARMDAIAEGSIPPVDTGVAAYAWPGALNEVVMRPLQGELPTLASTAPALSALLLRSVGAEEAGPASGR